MGENRGSKPASDRDHAMSVLQHPLLTLVLLVLFLFGMSKVFGIAKPYWFLEIPGYSREKMSEAFVITLRPECSCEHSAEDWLKRGIKFHKNLVVISEGQNSAFDKLKQIFSQNDVTFIYSNDKNLIHRLAPADLTTLSCVSQNQIYKQITAKDKIDIEGVIK